MPIGCEGTPCLAPTNNRSVEGHTHCVGNIFDHCGLDIIENLTVKNVTWERGDDGNADL